VGARFFAAVQTGPGVHPASCTMGTDRVSFPEVKRPGRGVDHPLPSSVRVKERVELYLYSPSGPSWPVPGRTLPFTFTTGIIIFVYNVYALVLFIQYCITVSATFTHTHTYIYIYFGSTEQSTLSDHQRPVSIRSFEGLQQLHTLAELFSCY
jgi:hypothetical protein